MVCLLLAMESDLLRGACREILHSAGHAVIELTRAIDLLSAVRTLRCDIVCVDESEMGEDALLVAHGIESPVGVIYVGAHPPPGVIAVGLPLSVDELLAAVNIALPTLPAATPCNQGLAFDRERRIAHSDGRDVWLTRTQARLLGLLIDRQPAPVATPDILREVWGYEGSDGDTELVRTHVRRLRRKLAEIGLGEAIQSQRGRGYQLTRNRPPGA